MIADTPSPGDKAIGKRLDEDMLTLPGELAALVLAVLLGVLIGWMVWGRGLTVPRSRRGPRHAARRRSWVPTSYGTDLSTGDVRVLPRNDRDGRRREPAHAVTRRETAVSTAIDAGESAEVAPVMQSTEIAESEASAESERSTRPTEAGAGDVGEVAAGAGQAEVRLRAEPGAAGEIATSDGTEVGDSAERAEADEAPTSGDSRNGDDAEPHEVTQPGETGEGATVPVADEARESSDSEDVGEADVDGAGRISASTGIAEGSEARASGDTTDVGAAEVGEAEAGEVATPHGVGVDVAEPAAASVSGNVGTREAGNVATSATGRSGGSTAHADAGDPASDRRRPGRMRVNGATARSVDPQGDDLRRIVGIGPVIHRVLLSVGVTTYRQVASLGEDGEALARAGAALGGDVRARSERHRWMEQAKELHFQKYGERL